MSWSCNQDSTIAERRPHLHMVNPLPLLPPEARTINVREKPGSALEIKLYQTVRRIAKDSMANDMFLRQHVRQSEEVELLKKVTGIGKVHGCFATLLFRVLHTTRSSRAAAGIPSGGPRNRRIERATSGQARRICLSSVMRWTPSERASTT